MVTLEIHWTQRLQQAWREMNGIGSLLLSIKVSTQTWMNNFILEHRRNCMTPLN